MHRGLVILALAGITIAWPSPGLALNPLDNDAGSGGDAGDLPATASSVQPGSYSGRVTGQHDKHDYYMFQAEQGQTIQVSLAATNLAGLNVEHIPNGRACLGACIYATIWEDESTTILLHRGGTWYVHIYSLLDLRPVEYTFTFSLSVPAQSVSYESSEGADVLEVRWTRPSDIVALGRVELPDTLDAFSGMVTFEFSTPLFSGFQVIHLASDATGRHLEIQPSPLPPADLPIDVSVTESRWAISILFWAQTDEGWIRATTYSTGGPRLVYAFADQRFLHERAETDDLVVWRESDAAASPHVVLPGLTVAGPRDFILSVKGSFLGFFYNWGDAAATITDPEGTDVPYLDGFQVFHNPRQGDWRFHLGLSAKATSGDRVYLDGFFVPDLHVVPPAPELSLSYP